MLMGGSKYGCHDANLPFKLEIQRQIFWENDSAEVPFLGMQAVPTPRNSSLSVSELGGVLAIMMDRRAFLGLLGSTVLNHPPFKRLLHSPIQCHYIQSLLAPIYLMPSQYWSMTTSKRVQDQSKKKRIQDLKIVVEKSKITSKLLFLMEVLKQEPEKIMPLRSMNQYRMQINLPKRYKLSDFHNSPKLFELYKDISEGMVWRGMTEKDEKLIEEEERIIEEHSEKLVEYVTRFLMMTVDKHLPLAKIAHFRRDFGLPMDFRENWVNKYPRHFKVVKNDDGVEFLELVSWNPAWAITELEKKVTGVCEPEGHQPGMLSLAFPLKFSPNYKQVSRYGGSIDHFQRRSYLSPYADACELKVGSYLFESDSEEDNVSVQTNDQDTIGGLEDSRISDQSEMELGEISTAYEDIESS